MVRAVLAHASLEECIEGAGRGVPMAVTFMTLVGGSICASHEHGVAEGWKTCVTRDSLSEMLAVARSNHGLWDRCGRVGVSVAGNTAKDGDLGHSEVAIDRGRDNREVGKRFVERESKVGGKRGGVSIVTKVLRAVGACKEDVGHKAG